MKKLLYTFAAGATLLAACQPGNTYKVTGSIDGLNDGDTVILQKREGRNLIPLDTAIMANGQFVFTGTADSIAVERWITFHNEEKDGRANFFLEKGNISIYLNEDVARREFKGTPSNEAWSRYCSRRDSLFVEGMEIYQSLADTTLTAEERAAKEELLNAKGDEMESFTIAFLKENIGNAAGISLLKQNYPSIETEELEALLAQVPAAYQADEDIQSIKEELESSKRTAVGQKFTDIVLQTPEGETVKLSDYVSQNKVTMIDFWASWCGPCRREMPNVVAAYKAYKDKGFGIVGVSLDSDAAAWKKAIEDLNITWPQMSDLKGWQCEGAKLYAVHAIPATVLIDGEGIIIAKDVRGEEIAKKLEELLK